MAAGNLLSHLFDIAPVTLKQSMEIAFGRLFNRAGLALKAVLIGAEMVIKMGKCRFDQTANAFGILRPSW